jgi:two-component system response regulator FixJ
MISESDAVNDPDQGAHRAQWHSLDIAGRYFGRRRVRDNPQVWQACSRPTDKEQRPVPQATPMETSDEPAEEEKQEEIISRGRVIVVIDDDAAVCDSTRVLLEVYDFEVLTYQSAAEFLKKIPEVSCLVVDYHMPGVNGLELVAELRKRGLSLPVIMITATEDATIERHAAELGVRSVLKKPLGNALIGAIDEALR